MKYSICRFKPKSSFHLGTKEGWIEGSEKQIHSDTLFSAFCHCYVLLYGQKELEEFLRSYDDAPPLILSSVYPLVEGRYLLPLPLNQFFDDPKKRGVQWLGVEDFSLALHGKSIEKNVEENQDCRNPLESKVKVEATPRVTISAFTNTVTSEEGGFYQIGQVFFDESVELYFIYELSERFPESKFKAVLNLMADEGIGGDRSVGKGFFHYPTYETIEVPSPPEANARVVLSLYYPQTLPMQDIDTAFYDFIVRAGYIFSPFEQHTKRKTVRMFTEASVFSDKCFDGGKLVDVTPNGFTLHRVYRYGVPLTMPCLLEVEKDG